VGKRAGVERPTPAIAEKHEIAGIAAVFDRLLTNRSRHGDGCDGNDTIRSPSRARLATVAERFGNASSNGLPCGAYIESKLAAEKSGGIEPAQK
jgi:hypothetical protein